MNENSAVAFAGKSRIHVGLAVRYLSRSVAFYQILFGQAPSKQRHGYAKFEIDAPSVNLSLNESSGAQPMALPAHFGVQVKSTDEVEAMARRFEQAGVKTRVEENTSCCYAVQDKVWVNDPDGNAWEVYVVLDDDAEAHTKKEAEAAEACCTADCCS